LSHLKLRFVNVLHLFEAVLQRRH